MDMNMVLSQLAKTNEMMSNISQTIGLIPRFNQRLEETIEENNVLRQSIAEQKELLMKMDERITSLSERQVPNTSQAIQQPSSPSTQRGGKRLRIFDSPSVDETPSKRSHIYKEYARSQSEPTPLKKNSRYPNVTLGQRFPDISIANEWIRLQVSISILC